MANKKENTEDASLRHIIAKFASKTTAHGIPNITASTTVRGRVTWSVIVLVGFGLFLVQSSLLLTQYLDYGVKVKVDLVSVSRLKFPTVTVCNTNKIRKSEIEKSKHARINIVDEEFVLPYYAPCLPSDFSCKNGTLCIKPYLVCDGINHCQDMSDEDDCVYGTCGTSQFRCSSGSSKGYCIDAHFQCDRNADCYNGEDEENCACNEDEFKCKDSSGSCIARDMVCDGITDCVDGSDEHYTTCAMMTFKKTSHKGLFPKEAVKVPNVSVEYCALSCLQYSMFVCLSFDYDTEEANCYLNPGNVQTIVFFLSNKDNNDYYERSNHDFGSLSGNTALKFQHFPNAMISPIKEPSVVTTEECAQLCLDETSFNCQAFTYQPQTSRCWLHEASYSLNGLPMITDSRYDYYERRGIECYALEDGTDYRGRVFVSSLGYHCKTWSALDPSIYQYTPSTTKQKGLGDHNYCRNPNGESGPWCYTEWGQEHCAVGFPKLKCLTQEPTLQQAPGTTPHPQPTTGETDCASELDGSDYRGNISVTESGLTCQKWTSQFPHTHKFVVDPDVGIGDHNFCRNPDRSSIRPWCYTIAAWNRWEYCDITEEMCDSALEIRRKRECFSDPHGSDYRGTKSVSLAGIACQKWTEQAPHQHSRTPDWYIDAGLGDHNYCRNPDNADNPWCYTVDPDTRWDWCDVGEPDITCRMLGIECFYQRRATDYRGYRSTTSSGRKCQKWTTQSPHTHSFDPDVYGEHGIGDHNYCRNPSGEEPTAWCFTTDPDVRSETCDVNMDSEHCITGRVIDEFSASGALMNYLEYLDYDQQYQDISVTECARLCLESNSFFCMFFDYFAPNNTCCLSSNVTAENTSQEPTLQADGIRYSRIIDDSEMDVVKFQQHPNRNMLKSGYQKLVTAANLPDCVTACLSLEIFNCLSLDFCPSCSTCYLYEQAAATAADEITEDISYVHLDRIDFASIKDRNGPDVSNVMFAFDEYGLRHLPGHTDRVFHRSTEADCAARCLKENDFHCLTFEYVISTRKCILSSESHLTLSIQLEDAVAIQTKYYVRRDIAKIDDNNSCPDEFELCGSGECVYRYAVCDTIPNCSDGSDEVDCVVNDTTDDNSYSDVEKFLHIPGVTPAIVEDFERNYYKDNGFSAVKGEVPPDWYGFKTFSATPDYSDLRNVLKLNRDEIKEYGHQAEDFILQCAYDETTCSPSDFAVFQDDQYGNCFKFNHGKNDSSIRYTNKQGSHYGLKLTLFLEQDEYISIYGRNAGARLIILPDDVTVFPQDEGITVMPGTVTSVAVKERHTLRKSHPYGVCSQEELSDNLYGDGYSYTMLACRQPCFQRHLSKYCGCVDSYITGEPQCLMTNITQDMCKQFIRYLFQSERIDCDCRIPCREKWYSKTISQSLWPASVHLSHLLKTIHSLSPKTKDINDAESVRLNLVQIEVYFEQLIVESTTEHPAYGGEDFLSDIGGTLGLYIGLSVITVAEFIELVAVMIRHVHHYRKAGRVDTKNKQTNPPIPDYFSGAFAYPSFKSIRPDITIEDV